MTAVSAGSAGSFAAVVTTPVDVVKTRIMLGASKEGARASEAAAQGGRGTAGKHGEAKTERLPKVSGWQTAQLVWRHEGLKGLFRGAALRGAWTAMGSGLYLGIYESGRAYLEQRRLDKEGGN